MYISNKTPDLFKNFFDLGSSLNFENRWVKLSEIIPWDKIEEKYGLCFSQDLGRYAADARLVCGLFIVKKIKSLTDEETLSEYEENPYIQAMCGRINFKAEKEVSPSLLSERRRKLSPEFWSYWQTEIIPLLDRQKIVKQKIQKNPKKNFIVSIIESLKEKFFN